jgi:hypothetical protein
MASPYEDLSPEKFWKTGVSQQHPLTITGLYHRRFEIRRSDRIATGGSCFAQHVAHHLRTRKFSVFDAEPAPAGLPDPIAQKFGYRLYSGRYGNIYTAHQFLQLLQEAYGEFQPAHPVWERDGRYFDAFRPSVEPQGLASAELVMSHRVWHLERVRQIVEGASIFVFTFGLTEAWIDKYTGTVYPTAPGTIAGSFDSAIYEFKNYSYDDVFNDFVAAREMMKWRNPKLKFLLTVSPVPLTATASNNHVLVATTYSKSVLRAVAGRLYELYEDVDYFPSYEIIVSPFTRGFFYEPNLRAVSKAGVEAVMRVFFKEHTAGQVNELPEEAATASTAPDHSPKSNDDVVCEEVLLEAFSR